MKLTDEAFISIINATPLISIDLVIRNEGGQILLGKRRNRPAQNFWFVPGGRILKNERLHAALSRISQVELGAGVALQHGKLLGTFDHFYADNYFDIPEVSTHYVALAYQFEISGSSPVTADDQHTEIRWWNLQELLASECVHAHTKMYFQSADDAGFRCDAG